MYGYYHMYKTFNPYIYYHRSVANIDTCSAPSIFGRARFFSVSPSQEGERGERRTYALSGAKHGGHHPSSSGARIGVVCVVRYCVAAKLEWRSYDNKVPGPKARFQRLVDGIKDLELVNMICRKCWPHMHGTCIYTEETNHDSLVYDNQVSVPFCKPWSQAICYSKILLLLIYLRAFVPSYLRS